jgi:molybdenum cofactor cytidylyltransferase
MNFGLIDIADAHGAVLAHSLQVGKLRFSKGLVLNADDVKNLRDAGVLQVTIAKLDVDEIDENVAAQQIGATLGGQGIHITDPVAGRVNLVASCAGVCQLQPDIINKMNRIDEALTIATLADFSRVSIGTLLATIKVIPYGAKQKSVQNVNACVTPDTIQVHGFIPQTVDLILTKTDGFKPSLLPKGAKAISDRIAPLGLSIQNRTDVSHEPKDVARAIEQSKADIVLILGASATSDRRDVIPAGISMAGGQVSRFGMPVDPGNLLVIGKRKDMHIVGLPGCARAPNLNGVDWVLERLAAGMHVGYDDIADMGVGGLLKEIPQRIHPRSKTRSNDGPSVGVLLAAGASSRMLGDDKLLREIDGQSLLRRSALSMLESDLAHVYVAIQAGSDAHRNTLDGLPVKIVEVTDAVQGMSASIRTAMAAIPTDTRVIVLGLADMPDITADHYNTLLAAHDPKQDNLIVRPITPMGQRGNPVLFDIRFKENLLSITGDQGARDIVKSVPEFVHEVTMSDEAVACDLDTPKAWDRWLSCRMHE